MVNSESLSCGGIILQERVYDRRRREEEMVVNGNGVASGDMEKRMRIEDRRKTTGKARWS